MSKDLRISPVARALFRGGATERVMPSPCFRWRCGRARDADGAGSSGLPGKGGIPVPDRGSAALQRAGPRRPADFMLPAGFMHPVTTGPAPNGLAAGDGVAAAPAGFPGRLGGVPGRVRPSTGSLAGGGRGGAGRARREAEAARAVLAQVHLTHPLADPQCAPPPGLPCPHPASRAGRRPGPGERPGPPEPPQRPKPCEHLSQVNALATPSHPGSAWASARTASPA